MALKVRGTCPKCGRVYDTEAPKDRATRRFRCDNGDCLGVVIARRIPPSEIPPSEIPPSEPAPEPTPASRPKRRATRVDGYSRTPERPAPVPASDLRAQKTAPAARPDPEPERVERREPEPKPVPEPERVERVRREPDGFTPYPDLY